MHPALAERSDCSEGLTAEDEVKVGTSEEPTAALRPEDLQLIPNTRPTHPTLHSQTGRPGFVCGVGGASGHQRPDLEPHPAGGQTREDPSQRLAVRQQVLQQSPDGNQGCRFETAAARKSLHSFLYAILARNHL